MRPSIIAAAALGACLLNAASAHEPQPAARSAVEQRNLDVAHDFWKNVFLPLRLERMKDYVAVDFIEHYPGLEGGLDNLVKFLEGWKKQNPNGLPPREPILSMVDGDLTFLLMPGDVVRDPADSSRLIQELRVEVQRWHDGKQIEHWDDAAVRVPPSGPQVFARSQDEERNLALVLEFWHNALGPIKTEQFSKYVAQDYVEHDASMPQGGLQALVAYENNARKKLPNGYPPPNFIHTLVDGDLVALVQVWKDVPDLKNPSKSTTMLGAHVLRVKNGKQVEHWGGIRVAPPGSKPTPPAAEH